MTQTAKRLMITFVMLVLVGCGSLNKQSPAASVTQMIKMRLDARSVQASKAASPVLTRAAADATNGAYLLMTLASSEATVALVTAGGNGNRVTWVSADQISVTLEFGLLVATRGFTHDLMATDVSQVIKALVSSGGTAVRTVEFLDGLDQISTELLQCSIASDGVETLTILEKDYKTEKFDEVCANETFEFTNVYWINDHGRIVQSRQLVSRANGFVEIAMP